jgi:hypothetical protein
MRCCLKTGVVNIDAKKRFFSASTLTTVTLFTTLTATLVACGGGASIQFPEPQAASPDAAQQRKATAAQAIELTQSLRQAVTQAVASGQKLTDVKDTVSAKAVMLPSGGTITEVRVEYGGAIVADVTLPTAQSAPATSVGTSSNPSGASASSSASLVEAASPSAAGGRGQLVWVAYPVAPGVVRWYCFGSFPTASQDTDGACLFPGESARGVTWGTQGDAPAGRFPAYDAKLNLSYVATKRVIGLCSKNCRCSAFLLMGDLCLSAGPCETAFPCFLAARWQSPHRCTEFNCSATHPATRCVRNSLALVGK